MPQIDVLYLERKNSWRLTMKMTLKTLAIAGLMGTVSAPAFAAAHMSTAMTCADYKALTADEQMTVATMAIAEVHDGMNGMAGDGEPKATEDSTGDTTADEATDDMADAGSLSDGEPKAVEATGGNEVGSNMTAEPMDEAALEAFMAVCNQNLDASVAEAAAGLDGTK